MEQEQRTAQLVDFAQVVVTGAEGPLVMQAYAVGRSETNLLVIPPGCLGGGRQALFGEKDIISVAGIEGVGSVGKQQCDDRKQQPHTAHDGPIRFGYFNVTDDYLVADSVTDCGLP